MGGMSLAQQLEHRNHAIKSAKMIFILAVILFPSENFPGAASPGKRQNCVFESRVTSAGEQPLENYNVYLIGLTSHGQRSLAGYSPGGGRRSDTTERWNNKAQRSGIFPFEFTSWPHLWLMRGPVGSFSKNKGDVFYSYRVVLRI